MAGYLTTKGSWTVEDKGPASYPHTVTATLDLTAGTGSSCDWTVNVSRPDWNFYRIYLSIDGTVCLDSYIQGNSKSKKHTGTTAISGDEVSITLGIATSQNSTADNRMTKITKTLTRTKWEDVSDGTLEIEDHFNNSFTIKATPGSGTNNPVLGHEIVWGYSSDYDSNTGAGEGLKSLTIINEADAERTVYVKSITGPTYGTAGVKTISEGIRQYVAPSKPGKPVISYSKNRLTIREPWKFTWTAALPANASSPIIGYRIRVMKNGVAITGLGCGTNDTIILDSSNKNNWVDRDSTSCSITFDPVELGFSAGDTVSVGLYSYTRFGEDFTETQLFNGGGYSSQQAVSQDYPVLNAGIVRVKEGDAWKEGQVYIKVSGTWKEADTVYTKVNGSWKESQ